jgi:polysaccharide biosynthesis PFTS motif protein
LNKISSITYTHLLFRYLGLIVLPALLLKNLFHRIETIHYLEANTVALRFLQLFIPQATIKRIPPFGHIQTINYGQALDIVDQVYTSLYERRITLVKLSQLIDSTALERIFKKELTRELAIQFYLFDTAEDLARNNRTIVLIESRLVKHAPFIGISKSTKVVLAADLSIYLDRFADISSNMIKRGILLGLPFFFIFRSIMNLLKRVNQETFRHAVLILNSKHQFKANGKYFDFLIDDQLVKSEDVIFLQMDRIATDQLKKHRMRGRHISSHLSYRNVFVNAQAKDLFSLVKRVIPGIIGSLVIPLDHFIVKGVQVSIMNYLRWSLILKNYQFDNLVTFNDEQTSHIARNSVLSNASVKTWYYCHSAASGYSINNQLAPIDTRHILWSFLSYDHYLTWNEAMRTYIMLHPVFFKQIHTIGCLWSEFIEQTSNLGNEKIILVFDTSYFGNIDEGVVFYRDIAEYARTRESIRIIYKPKKELSFYIPGNNVFSTPEYWKIEKLYAELEPFDNIEIVSNDSDAYAMISQADLVITHAISSTTIEAIGAKKKAVFYDPAGRFRDTYYDQVPEFILHEKETLWKRLDYLLNLDQLTYGQYLDEHYKNIVDPFLDGKGMSRLRELLTAANAKDD